MIQMVDLAGQYRSIKPEIDAAVAEVLAGGEYILGRHVEAFEAAVAGRLGVTPAQCVSCSSGSDALLLSLMAIGLGPGDEVITTPFTFVATAGCVTRLGGVPVFVDVAGDCNIDASLIEQAVTGRTRAVISVDLYGQPADHAAIADICRRHGLAYVSDSAQAFGTPLGPADFTTYSFFPSKTLGCFGDGGMVVCRPDRAESMRQLRAHGSRQGQKYAYDRLGINSRLDAIQAAILRVKLRHVDSWIARRRANAAIYDARLPGWNPQKPGRHVYHQYTVVTARRDGLAGRLAAAGIATAVYYPQPLHLQGCLGGRGACPVAEKMASQVVSLPVHEGISADEIHRICELVDHAE